LQTLDANAMLNVNKHKLITKIALVAEKLEWLEMLEVPSLSLCCGTLFSAGKLKLNSTQVNKKDKNIVITANL
jgi:hypothetical protein